MKLPFFLKKKKSISINKIFPKIKSNIKINNIRTLDKSKKFDLTFFDSIKYKPFALRTEASFCITTEKLKKFLPNSTEKIVVKNVLFELAKVLKKLYPSADVDYPDSSLKSSSRIKFKSVKFGNNVLVGKNVKIGKNSVIGSNTIIEHDVILGKNCVIGSGVIIKNSVFGNNIVIQDGCKIGVQKYRLQKSYFYTIANKKLIIAKYP